MAELLERLGSALGHRYRLERELGQGGMATVYLAHDLRHEREVAIKVLRPELAATLGSKRFLQEIQIAARLTHPHILPLHDSGEVGGFLYYVMPYVEGESLRDKLTREGELPIPEALRILREVTDALAYAHARGVVHRDIKPENVMLSGRHAMVMDFGVAKALHEATGRQRLTSAGVALGTPAYMSPEQAGADSRLDHRTDLYAVGAVGYELLTGQPPFTGSSPQMVLAAQITQRPRPVTDHRPGVQPALALTIMRCLEKNPADRWQTAGELQAQFEALATLPSGGVTLTSTRPLEAVTVRRTGGRVSRWSKLAGAAVIVLTLAWGGWQLTHRAPGLIPGRIIVAPFENKTGNAAQDLLGESIAERLAAAIRAEGMDVVPTVAMEAERRHQGESRAVTARHLSARNSASIVVTGSYLQRPGGVEYRAELLRMPEAKLIVAVAPRGADSGYPEAIERFIERTLVALVANQESGAEFYFVGMTLPSSLASFRELVHGDALGSPQEKLTSYARARALDSAWTFPLVRMAQTELNRGRYAACDSILAVLDSSSEQAQPGDRDLVDWVRSQLRGDLENNYLILRRLTARAPLSFSNAAVWAAVNVNRPLEALSYLKYRDMPSYGNSGTGRRAGTHLGLGHAFHILGRYKEELELLLETEREYPNAQAALMTLEVQVRAGLGQVAEVERLITRFEGFQRGAGNASNLALIAGLELAAHGHPEAARAMFLKNLAWYRTSVPQQSGPSEQIADDSVLALLGTRDYRAVRSAAEIWVSRDSTSPAALYYLGISAAHLGDRAVALGMERRLAALKQPYLYGENTDYRAAIFAVLGDKGMALELLRQAYSEGYYFGHHTHRDPDYDPLRDFPPFQEFIRPKG